MNVYGEMKHGQLECLSADPSTGKTGRIFYQTTAAAPKYDNGSAIKAIMMMGSAVSNNRVASKTSTYTALISDNYIPCSSSGGAFSVNLPAAATSTNLWLTIKKTDTSFNAVTIDPNGSELIDGSSTTTLNTQGEAVVIVCDGTGWQIVNRIIPSTFTAYTPTFTGFGSPSAIECVWRRQGDSIRLHIKFTCGVVTTVEGRISLPSGLTSSGSSKITSIRFIGSIAADDAGGAGTVWGGMPTVLIEPSVTYMTFGTQNSGATFGLTKMTANDLFLPSSKYSFTCSLPISGWNG